MPNFFELPRFPGIANTDLVSHCQNLLTELLLMAFAFFYFYCDKSKCQLSKGAMIYGNGLLVYSNI